MSPLCSAEWLVAHLGAPDVVVADVRWQLGDRQAGRRAYAAGHIPGAHFVDLDTELSEPPGPGLAGRHPLPSPARLSGLLRRLAVGPSTRVIAYDDTGGAIAARLWWLLTTSGRATCQVLDGGLSAWRAAGGQLVGGPAPAPAPAPAVADADAAMVVPATSIVDRQQLAGLLGSSEVVLLDARNEERFAGHHEAVDARPGHVPGARNAPWAGNLCEQSGRFRSSSELRERFAALGVSAERPAICYCGSGVTACHDLLALQVAGFEGARLYPGSWSDWAADASLPAETG